MFKSKSFRWQAKELLALCPILFGILTLVSSREIFACGIGRSPAERMLRQVDQLSQQASHAQPMPDFLKNTRFSDGFYVELMEKWLVSPKEFHEQFSNLKKSAQVLIPELAEKEKAGRLTSEDQDSLNRLMQCAGSLARLKILTTQKPLLLSADDRSSLLRRKEILQTLFSVVEITEHYPDELKKSFLLEILKNSNPNTDEQFVDDLINTYEGYHALLDQIKNEATSLVN